MNMKNEQGRSMVEMLGVLSIIGVLSVAGIAGYTTAMNQHRANEAINTAMRAAVMLSAQRLANPNATLNTSDLGDGITVGSDTDKLVLTLSNVDEKVRSRIEAMGLKNATIGSDENGALTFTFYNDLSERSSGTSGGNPSGGGEQQEPQVTCDDDPSICEAWQTCVNGECICNDALCLQICPSTRGLCSQNYIYCSDTNNCQNVTAPSIICSGYNDPGPKVLSSNDTKCYTNSSQITYCACVYEEE